MANLEIGRHLGAFFRSFGSIAGLVAASANLLAVGFGLAFIVLTACGTALALGIRFVLAGSAASAFAIGFFSVRVVARQVADRAADLFGVVADLNVRRGRGQLAERRFARLAALALLSFGALLSLLVALLTLFSFGTLLSHLALLSLLSLLAGVGGRHRQ